MTLPVLEIVYAPNPFIPGAMPDRPLPEKLLGSVISVTEVNLARVPRALEGEVRGVVGSRGWVRGVVKVAVRGEIEMRCTSTRSFPIFLASRCVSKPYRRQPNGSHS